MLRMQPMELVNIDMDHIMLRCNTASGRVVEFTYNTIDFSGIEDVFFFVTCDDTPGSVFFLGASGFDNAETAGGEVFDLPSGEWCALRLRHVATNAYRINTYVITFKAGEEELERQFLVESGDSEMTVRYGEKSWLFRRHNVHWKIEEMNSSPGGGLVPKALVYFDWSISYEYSDEELMNREKEIPWDAYYHQEGLNKERRAKKQLEWAQKSATKEE